MGYQNSTLPIAVYGCIDTCSRKMLWAKVWIYLYKARTTANKLRLDKGSETGVMALNALLSPTAAWGHGSSGDSHVWAINFQSSMCTHFCDAVFFSHQSTWILTLNVCRNVLPFVLVIRNNIETPSGHDEIPNLQGSSIYTVLLANYLNFLV